ncbi:hypothetical protein G6F55_002515 [Rhizopus delemar]|uniref:Chitinase n=2 Tax=Rhizopus TaxID=4842 RepID=A0A9P7CPQ7_9FUNG|nr:hypothetical protein G6F55_002515 [Rhizopus delemar]KAG1547971.1 hypothetical protein G6F51_003945 [Rhizopus arrhizus]KAG1501752.1 hypothetical protein G6F54_002828 [Rhizopus delemar]KAG1512989.1 hypothetical protein G6F53_004769 [Rhizopus delemar]KAG1527476.1 hypothetical protein G6F52_001501 [Rhizopus delemar]
MAPASSFNKRKGYNKRGPTPGSVLPRAMKEELESEEQDDRKFGKKFISKIGNRKELRKQKRAEKGKRKAERHQNKKRSLPAEQSVQPNKRQKKVSFAEPEKHKKEETVKRSSGSEEEAMKRLSKKNPELYKLLVSDNLVSGGDKMIDEDLAEDDREIAYWEKKLGMDKKKKKLGKEFEEDGLMDILGKMDTETNEVDDLEYLKEKRLKQAQLKQKSMEKEAEKTVDRLFDSFPSDEESEDPDEGSDEEYGNDIFKGFDSEEEEDSEEEDDEEEDDEEEDDEEEEEEEDDEEEEGISSSNEDDDIGEESETSSVNEISVKSKKDKEDTQIHAKTSIEEQSKSAMLTKYVPPHLRKAASGKSEQQIRLQKQLQGQLNRLSELNIESILVEIEKCYSSYPRHDVTSTITELIISSISQRSNLLDSFVITYATIVASLYRLIGIEFAAHFVQTLVETYEKEHNKCRRINKLDDNEGSEGYKETKNLLTLILELYNFQVISCILIYDLVRVLIGELDEGNVELLLRIIRTAGAELRSDDPASLKHIIDEIQKETAKRDPSTISIRHKFMLETIADVKNNKIKNKQTAAGTGDKELALKMKKFLNGLSKKRVFRSTEPLRVSLEDIHNVETKGKWWLVGASWKDNLVGTESKYSSNKMPDDLKKDQSMQEALLKLARKQGMNTDIRRTIFITIMSAEDYLDAFEKLLKLGLNEIQQREICRVMLQCTGNEKTFNPYYMLVSKRLCEVDHSFKVTFQYCLWDFLRECGESDVGGLERSSNENYIESKDIRLSRIVNMAKFYASLIADGALTLVILKSVNFMNLQKNGRIFLETLFANIFLQLHAGGAQAVANIFGRNACNHNVVGYWGQNSFGAANGQDRSGWQKSISFYCDDDSVDVFPISFLTTFFGPDGTPQINLANTCNNVDNATFPGTTLANCQTMAPDIKYCQSKGKLVTLSLGGATGGVGFQSDSQATSFADTIWNLFLGGESSIRPFGDAILDGIDLDIEGGGSNHYTTFLQALSSHFVNASKKYYITAAPQCVFPDANLQATLNSFSFDAIYVQFYNNPCGLQFFNTTQWNFGVWDNWARTSSPNPNVKVYIGAPASSSAAGSGYVSASTLLNIALDTRNNFPSFGGIMFWDVSQAYGNNKFGAFLKNGLSSGSSCNGKFNFLPCTAPAYVSGTGYSGGSRVSYNGYTWIARWYASSAPSSSPSSEWLPIMACSNDNSGSTSGSYTSKTLPSGTNASSSRINISSTPQSVQPSASMSTTTFYTKSSAVPSTTSTAAIISSRCASTLPWSPSVAYTGGVNVYYNNAIWRAKWWSQNDVPGGIAGVWEKVESCEPERTLSSRSILKEE